MNYINSINVSICGHIDHGKSALAGRLLVDCKLVSQKKLKWAEEFAAAQKPPELPYQYLLYRTKLEPTLAGGTGRTEKFSWIHIPIGNKTITLIDTPGHTRYYKNRVSGIFNSDFGILVVDVNEGVREGTLEALYILKGLGVPLIAVVFSKLDLVDYLKERFEEVKNDVLKKLKDLDIDTETVKICPTSAKDGKGITNEKVWDEEYPTFFEIIQGINYKNFYEKLPLRIVFRRDDFFRVTGIGIVGIGEVKSGTLRKGETIIFQPDTGIFNENITARVKSIKLARPPSQNLTGDLEKVAAGNLISVALHNPRINLLNYLKEENISGHIASTLDSQVLPTNQFQAEIIIADYPGLVRKGFQFTLMANCDHAVAEIEEILEKKSLEENSFFKNPQYIKEGEIAKVNIRTERKIAIESDDKIPILSKFVMYSGPSSVRSRGDSNVKHVLDGFGTGKRIKTADES